MKTSFKIAWVDDNLSDDQMEIAKRLLGNRLRRKNSFSLEVGDIYSLSEGGVFDDILVEIVNEVDSSNSIDLAMIDYELGQVKDAKGEVLTGPQIAKRFRDSLPTLDIVFYSGKKSPSELRDIMAEENVDCVSCIDRKTIADDTFAVIEKILHRSYKISTLRGLILNSVCQIDHMIEEILSHFANVDDTNEAIVRNRAIELIDKNANPQRLRALRRRSVPDLLKDKNMMSGKLFTLLFENRGSLKLASAQLSILGAYKNEILKLRTSAAHSKETVCPKSSQAMLKFQSYEYRQEDINNICKTLVKHESNIRSILQGFV